MQSALRATGVTLQAASIRVTWSDRTTSEFANVWLRDNLPEDCDRHSGQRLVDVLDLPAQPRIRSAAVDGDTLAIAWAGEARQSSIPLAWLHQMAHSGLAPPELAKRPWLDAAALVARRDFAWLRYPLLQTDPQARLDWLTRLLQQGLAFLAEVPQRDQSILQAMSLVGYVPETNYGRVFDVRTVAQPENLAFSDRGLGLHTDNPYREPVPGFQALHTLVAAPDGGDSLFADGLALAEHLRATEPEAFRVLTRTPVPFQYQTAGAELYAERPLIELSCDGAVEAVSYNNRSIRPPRLPVDECTTFYDAYRKFAALLREPRLQMTTRLENGDLALFDNRRVLHGRTGFASANHPRHLQGCYLTRDSVYSTTAVLRRQLAGGAAT